MRRCAPTRAADPALKEGALLTNVFNRLARSCFYEAQKNFEGFMPLGAVSEEMVVRAQKALADFEAIMHKAELHSATTCADEFIRWAQKGWFDGIKRAEKEGDNELRRQVLLTASALRVSALLMHPIAPAGCEMIAEYLQIAPERVFGWDAPFGMDEQHGGRGVAGPCREGAAVEDRFFEKHPSQFK